MTLQTILTHYTENALLYTRQTGRITQTPEGLLFSEGSGLATNTYFNVFSMGKWKKYCDLSRIFLTVTFKGAFLLWIIHTRRDGAELTDDVLLETKLQSEAFAEERIDFPDCKNGVIYFKLEALEEGSCFRSARYETERGGVRDVKIALNICTFKREQYLLRNLAVLEQSFLCNPSSPLGGHLEVFVTDNGRTLDIDGLCRPGIRIVHNPNLGGTGGFARGLMEIMEVKEKTGITHVIFMDDDVEIEPESIARTYALLRLLKRKYDRAFIAGAMLRLDQKYIQHENGALWREGKCRFYGRGLDLRSFSNVVLNEEVYERDYAAWWYCCVPSEILRRDNLPVPLFIHEDDVEYSLRNARQIITMNGIAIWHEANGHRRISANEYYNLRNMLIVNALHCPHYSAGKAKRQVLTALLVAVFRFRYKDMYLIAQAVTDFCKGPHWLLRVNAAKYHQMIQQRGYSFQDMTSLLAEASTEMCAQDRPMDGFKYRIRQAASPYSICRLLVQLLTFNGYFLPAKRKVQAHYMNAHPVTLFRAGRLLLFDDADGKGILTRRRMGQVFEMARIFGRLLRVIDTGYRKSCREYRREYGRLKAAGYWEKALFTDSFH